MRQNKAAKITLIIVAIYILLPVLILFMMSVAGRRPWPLILPETWTSRALEEIAAPHNKTLKILFSSIGLSLLVAVLATLTAAMAARAIGLRQFRGKGFFRFAGILPILIPGTVLAMGFHTILLQMGIADSLWGVVLIHVISALPYATSVLFDVFEAIGTKPEEQAAVLGAPPLRAFVHAFLPQILPGVFSALGMSFIISYSQYFTTLLAGGGKVKTLSLVMVPYIDSGDRSLASAYALLFVFSALLVFVIIEAIVGYFMRRVTE